MITGLILILCAVALAAYLRRRLERPRIPRRTVAQLPAPIVVEVVR